MLYVYMLSQSTKFCYSFRLMQDVQHNFSASHSRTLYFVDYRPAEPPFVVHFFVPFNTKITTRVQYFPGESILGRVEKPEKAF